MIGVTATVDARAKHMTGRTPIKPGTVPPLGKLRFNLLQHFEVNPRWQSSV
jgi:hypothetical protein